MGVAIMQVKLLKNHVTTGEKIKISVAAKESVREPITYRFPFKYGQEKGGIK